MTSTFSRLLAYSAGSEIEAATRVVDNRSLLSAEDTGVRRIRPRVSAASTRKNVLRRLRGFLVDIEGSVARVCFIEGDQHYEYLFPAELLQKAGIKKPHQPLEMDEFEQPGEDGSFALGYSFKPMAKASERFIEPLEFDEAHQQKLQFLLRRLKNAPD